MQTKVIRNQVEIVKMLRTQSYPKSNSVKNCEIVFYDLECDLTGNLIYYRTKDSCSATYEKYKLEIEDWQSIPLSKSIIFMQFCILNLLLNNEN